MFAHADMSISVFLSENHHKSSFLASVYNQLQAGRRLSEKQLEAVARAQAAMSAPKPQVEQTEVNVLPIKEMFDRAFESGYKKPVYRAEGVVLSRAPNGGANPGAIYVKNEHDEYQGKIIDGKFTPVKSVDPATKANLLEISKDPQAAAVKWGKLYGRCSCCGRELSDPESVAMGIGPICAARWF